MPTYGELKLSVYVEESPKMLEIENDSSRQLIVDPSVPLVINSRQGKKGIAIQAGQNLAK